MHFLYSKRIHDAIETLLQGLNMAAIHWKEDFEQLPPNLLLPAALPAELLISVARSLAMYKDGVLDRAQMKGVWELLECWITRLLDAQDGERHAFFKKHSHTLLPELADELDLWIRMEIVSRQIGYPVYEVTFATLFSTHFQESAE